MLSQAPQEQETTITVDRGLFVLRYATGATNHRSPLAMVRPAPASTPYVEVISGPGVIAGFLSSPGDCVVVRAEQTSKLIVKIMAQRAGDPLDASFKLEPLSGAELQNPARIDAGPAATNGDELTILAHVSRRGDVEVASGAWIAGPDAPAPIEGLEVRGALPANLSLEIQPLLATNPPRWLDWVSAGKFVGTRQRALPLAGLRLRLGGNQSQNFEILSSALFLGSPVQRRQGQNIELIGSGFDPLVGLTLEIAPAERAPENGVQSSIVKSDKIKIFRSSAMS